MFDHQLYLQASFYFFYLFTIEPVELLVAKSYYSIGLSVAKSSNILSVAKSSNISSVAKSWTIELSVAKDDVLATPFSNSKSVEHISNCRGPSL